MFQVMFLSLELFQVYFLEETVWVFICNSVVKNKFFLAYGFEKLVCFLRAFFHGFRALSITN